eukprot:TRINITY_DN4575_c0_g1_i1.p2 TRINITY_DN4575_c0_g1~~TRINITY_DN4575_c0_g1_i1.p2  ORF type:complete len:232 (+),score=68.11 TRINITY_DN4575_c0_g1_i1:556-1251(+)
MGVNRHLLGTYATFYHQEGPADKPHIYDNRLLAALFGLDPAAGYTTKKLVGQPKYDVESRFKDSVLFHDVPLPYSSLGYNSTQIPTAGTPQLMGTPWTTESGALRCVTGEVELVARSSDNLCIIVNFVAARFSSLYISHMPEYESLRKTKVDVQLLYNSFIFLYNQGLHLSLFNRCTEYIVRNISNKALFERVPVDKLPVDLQNTLHSVAKMSGRLDSKSKYLFGKCQLEE